MNTVHEKITFEQAMAICPELRRESEPARGDARETGLELGRFLARIILDRFGAIEVAFDRREAGNKLAAECIAVAADEVKRIVLGYKVGAGAVN